MQREKPSMGSRCQWPQTTATKRNLIQSFGFRTDFSAGTNYSHSEQDEAKRWGHGHLRWKVFTVLLPLRFWQQRLCELKAIDELSERDNKYFITRVTSQGRRVVGINTKVSDRRDIRLSTGRASTFRSCDKKLYFLVVVLEVNMHDAVVMTRNDHIDEYRPRPCG